MSLQALIVTLLAITNSTFSPILSAAGADAASSAPPNIVIILVDDLGWADVGYHGDRVRTPNLDSLVRDGVELDRFYVCPMCSPTRAALMTGRFPIRLGMARAVIPPWRDFGLSTKAVTLAEALGERSYKHRGIFGKWHLGHRRREWHPLERGFTEFEGHYNGAIDYFTLERDGERDWHRGYEPSDAKGYATDLIAEAAASFIRRHANDGPFLCYVPFNAPHSPFQAPERYVDRYAKIQKRRNRVLRGMIECLDDGVGKILTAIDATGARANTVVWFFSDNGGIAGVVDNNLPLRGNKLSVYEGGIRVPAAIRWPDVLPKGKKITEPISCVDVLPTLLGIAGIHGEKELSAVMKAPVDGRNVLETLRTNARGSFEYFAYHGQNGPEREHATLIRGPWKLIVRGPDVSSGSWQTTDHTVELFRLDVDPSETGNLLDVERERVASMARDLIAYRRLQPADSAPPYAQGRRDLAPIPSWRIPDRRLPGREKGSRGSSGAKRSE